MRLTRLVSVVVLTALPLLALPPGARAAVPSAGKPGPGGTADGYDISYPQCGGPFPSGAGFGVVGVNDGIVFSANPCLGTGDGPSELAWAQQSGNSSPAFYANTANPGPGISSHWPVGQSAPYVCSATDENSAGCSYDYGYNAARDSFTDAVGAEEQVNGLSEADSQAAAARAGWWLDVETGNSWETLESAFGDTATSEANDTAALEGGVAALQELGAGQVGFYSTASQWTRITGGASFPDSPDWVPGFRSSRDAAQGCTPANSFTGGPVAMTQYTARGFDADHRC